MKKSAFTMMELIFVIVVIGILSAVFIPRFGQNNLSQAANQLISHIRYTQHLALMDDKYDKNDQYWYKGRWQIFFSQPDSGKIGYWIYSDSGNYNGNPDANAAYTKVEVASNPLNKNLYLIGVANSNFDNYNTSRLTEELDIKTKYGILDFKVTGGTTSTSKTIAFDSLGRPYKGDINNFTFPADHLAKSKIYVKLCRATCTGTNQSANNSNEIVIVIEPETGYVHLK